MTPKVAEAVDRVFLHVLGLLERIDRDENPSPNEERNAILAQLSQADAKLGQTPDWRLAKYAIVAWIDDLLIDAPWTGRDSWTNNALEPEFFGGRVAFEDFFVKAKEAVMLPNKDALEVFYVCVVLGFRGLYRSGMKAEDAADAARTLERLDLPPDVESWARQTGMAIRLGSDRPPLRVDSIPADSAPPLESHAVFVFYAVVGVLLLALDLLAIAFCFQWLVG